MQEKTNNAPIRILVVEDETIVSLDLQSSLKILGYKVVGAASSGPEAIAKAESTKPDLILMDIILKGDMDGVQAAEAIRTRLNVPVIFLTACADESTLHRAKVTEPFGYMIKPFEERELHSHIEIALYKHRIEKQLRESEERYFLATQGANDGLWDWNIKDQKIYFSPRWKTMLGYAESSIGNSPMDWFNRIHPSDREQVEQRIAQHLKGTTGHFESEYRILDAKGEYRWVLCRGMARRDDKGDAHRIAGSQTDITDRKVYNPLTGLPNRILFIDRLEYAMKLAKPQAKTFGVAAIEIGDVKTIASSLGYVCADKLVCQIARKIQASLSANDTVAHFGNDDFVILMEDVTDEKLAAIAASRVQRELEKQFEIDGQTVYIAPHTGITLHTAEYVHPEELVRDAYAAMQRAKAEGNGHFEIFDRKMRSSAIARLKLEADLRSALENRQFRIHYQPITCLKTGRLTGFEALVRWQRMGDLLYPKDFLCTAEAMDLLIPLEQWVLKESCRQMASWKVPESIPLTLNVNLCPRHYSDPKLVGEIREVLEYSGLAPQRLSLEITESALMNDSETLLKTLSDIRAMDVHLHMDDFGTGYSSLSYLNRFPIDSLKIDRSFVGNLGMCEETWKIVQAIVNLGKNLEMELIAEGIENMMQLRMLQTLKCDFGQGYYFAKPLEPKEAASLIASPPSWLVVFKDKSVAQSPYATQAS